MPLHKPHEAQLDLKPASLEAGQDTAFSELSLLAIKDRYDLSRASSA